MFTVQEIRTDKYVTRYDNKAVRGIEKGMERRPYHRETKQKSQRYWMQQAPTLDRLWWNNIVVAHSHHTGRTRFCAEAYIHVNYRYPSGWSHAETSVEGGVA